jgi:PAS domain S-box-containing protein
VTASSVKDSFAEEAATLGEVSEKQEAQPAAAWLASMIDSSEDTIHSVTLDGTIVSWNHGAEVLFGYSSREILGKNIAIIAPPERCEHVWQCLETIRQGASVSPFDTVFLAKDGRRIDVSLSISPIRNPAGEVGGASGIARDIRSRLMTERRLLESEDRFRRVFEDAPSGMCVSRTDGSFVQVNAAFCRMLGYSEQELLDTPWAKITHPDDITLSLGLLEEMYKHPGGCLEAEKRYLHRNGSIVWVRIKISVVRDIGGNPSCHLVHVENITERKQAKEALRESEERFRIMADGCPTLMWVTDAKGWSQFANRAYQIFCGTSAEHVEGVKWQKLLHPDDAQAYLQEFQRVVQSQMPFRAEARVRRADGEWRWVATFAEPRLSTGGEFLGHVGLCLDITERRKTEQALQQSEEKFRQLAENIREVFWMVQPATNEILYVSPAYEQIWDRTCASLYENPASRLETIHPEDRERIHSLLPRLEQGESLELEYRIRTPDGQEKWIRDRAFPIRDRDGQLTRVVGIAEEITERKRYQDELVRAREGADDANQAKSRFLANTSHEIRTPMNGVIGMVQLLLETDLTPEQRRYASVAQTSGRALLTLIDDILDLSKIEAGKITLENLSLDLRHTVEDVIQLARAQASAKGLQVHSDISPNIPRLLRGDAHRLHQVLTNLCANAIKFTEQGGVTLEAVLESKSDRGATIRFSIADTGIGIRSEQVAVLFSPFTQADVSTTRKYGGTGLGLAICKHLVEMMGGTIGVEGREGHGSTFWFTAVFGLASPDQQHCEDDGKHGFLGVGRGTISTGRRARILVAEDNATNREVSLAQLRKLGHDPSAVTNGEEAIAAVEGGGYDLVLMDCQMPVMDGFEATRLIRKSICPTVPIIAVTADAMPADRDRCLREGMNDYLAKPVELGRLAEVLAKWMPSAPTGDTAQSAGRRVDRPTKASFDKEKLLGRVMQDRELARNVLASFLADIPSQLQKLRTRLDEADAAGVRSQAHTLKGASATVAAEGLRAIALAIEGAAAAGMLDPCNDLLARACEEFEGFKRAVARLDW